MNKYLALILLGVLQMCVGQLAWAECDINPSTLTYNVGALYIPQDAPVGSTIGIRKYSVNKGVTCTTSTLFTAQGNVLSAKVGSVPVAVGKGLGESVYSTNIPGVGAIVNYDGGVGYWCRVGDSTFPISIESCGPGGSWAVAGISIFLVKTGPIGAGSHDFNGLEIYSFDINNGSGPERWATGVLNGSITVAGCSLPQETGNIVDVPMGTWERRVFNGPGTTTTTQNFSITLNNCLAGTYVSGQAWNYFQGNNANIRLEGVRGSAIVDAGNGVMGLNAESTAKGVAVQVLKQDGTPLPLGVDTPVMPVRDGVTTLQFGARYIQTAGSTIGPEPGVANATANFTITYK
ncbi:MULTISPECIES: fimbrial protein [unclassified Pseudomonas]|jgi:type 1 fimbria pilin|uniref:fimbrial protein n=1 Tax=unclassified Pseudomonas TaxID=196821 RepID=UPI000C86A7EE|nr:MULTISPECIES: fimbrial protein [unclassified Pseudomonas]NWB42988.1 fimbrial protein [Pseudomonas sp. E6002]PMU18951.1 hypothetical protein C1X90_23975 [Pseudomonas sp. GP01-A9]PMU26509.1 hypothetical protein C1X88_21500 [Pseudomonas sp. GP01-A13]PMU35373.1 hypothetical protein C1X89_22110 [Pseudomonas sp. GP01-A8]PMU51283.1 hypothetical protein C1X87_13320 [Pseudomonas sp. GP01-A14]